MSRIYFTVTNDLSFDQRMHRICTSLAASGYSVVLVGRRLKDSLPLQEKTFSQERLTCLFNRGFLFYAEYNLRLFFYLLFRKMDAIVAIDLDTILPCLMISILRRKKRVYDAHEFFTELKEVRTRPFVKMIWTTLGRLAIPLFHQGYTVSEGLSEAFRKKFRRQYEVIRNFPVLEPLPVWEKKDKFLLYQGAVNEGRGLEFLVPAMKAIPYPLIICGDGNFMQQIKKLIAFHDVGSRITCKGMLLPEELRKLTTTATIGIALSEREGINQYHALPNKFLDYIHGGLPQVTMNFPEYRKINDRYRVAVLIDNLMVENISKTVNEMMDNPILLEELHRNCLHAREVYCWQKEEIKLTAFYKNLFT